MWAFFFFFYFRVPLTGPYEHFHESPDNHPWSPLGLFVGAAGHTLHHVHKSGVLGQRTRDAVKQLRPTILPMPKPTTKPAPILAATAAVVTTAAPTIKLFDFFTKSKIERSRRAAENVENNNIYTDEIDFHPQNRKSMYHHDMAVCLSESDGKIDTAPHNDFIAHPFLVNRQSFDQDKSVHETIGEFMAFAEDAHVTDAEKKSEYFEIDEAIARRKRETHDGDEPKTVVLNYEMIVEHTNDKFNHDNVPDTEPNPLDQVANKLLASGCPCAAEHEHSRTTTSESKIDDKKQTNTST